MNKIIKINIKNREDIFNKYDNSVVSDEIICYLLEKAKYLKRNDNLKIEIENATDLSNKEIKELIILGLKEEYNESIKHRSINNWKELIFLLIGIIFLYLSNYLGGTIISKELLLIGGWVFIWETVELEFIHDNRERRKRSVLLKIINSNFII